ncbi:MAG TPA: regulatory protein RecX [Gaiellaceae bacterium]|jgi:regulatory protein|nr:regulatory protein RecX [Gaiellaceae bacterium]
MDPIEVAARSLRHRDRSRSEVDERLAKAGVGEEERTEALERLAQLGYVDDGRFAAERAAALAGRGQGDAAIRFDLQGRGVDPDAIEAALAGLVPEAERAVELADRLGRTAKTMGQLRRKGFGADALEAAFGSGIAGPGP